MGIISMIKNRMTGEEESVIKRRGMEQWHRPGDVSEAGSEQYKRTVSEMPSEEREKERRLRVQENKGMSEWHKHEEKRHPFESKKYRTGGIREQYIGTGESTYISPEEEEHINELMSEYKGKEREEVEARLKGFKSTAERKEIRTRIGRDITKKVRERYQEQNYNPEERYTEAVDGLKYRVGIAKEDIKKLATPAGLAGGIIGAISPKMTVEEKIKEERKKAALEEKIAKRRELLEKREHEIFVAAAYGSGKIPQKVVVKKVRVGTSPLRGAFGMGGFSLGGRPQRPVQRVVSRGQPQAVKPVERPSEPFGLSAYSGSPAPRRMEQRRAEPVRTEQRRPERVVIRQVPRPSVPVVGDISFVSIGTNPVNDRSANNLVNINGSRELVSIKKTGKSTDPFGASNYF